MDTLRSRLIRLAHSNPPLRPHLLPILKEAGTKWRDKLKAYNKKPRHYFHFSDRKMKSLSINPNSQDAPFGMYVYQADFDKVAGFALDRQYVFVIKNKSARILHLRKYTEQNYQRDFAKLAEVFPPGKMKKALEKLGKLGQFNTTEKTPGEKIWFLTDQLTNSDKHQWSNLFLSVLKYDGVEDDCEGIIWGGEDCQAVFFDVSKFELVEVIKKKLGDTQLFDVDVEDAPQTDYSHQDLSGKTLGFPSRNPPGAVIQFPETDLNFNGTNFSRANISPFYAWRADFANANLSGAVVRNANITGSDFSGANLRGLDLDRNDLQWCKFPGADLTDAGFKNVNLSGADLTGATLVNTNFTDAQFILTKFTGTKLVNVNFEGCLLNGTDFKKCTLMGVDFSRAVFDKPNLSGARYDARTKFPDGFDPIKAKMKPLA